MKFKDLQQPFIIAEMSGNHNHSLPRALQIVEAAAKAGAHALKLQTYTADTITINSRRPEFIVNGGLWDGDNLYSLYQKAATPWEWHKPIYEKCRKLGLICFSTPFDFTAVDFLEELGNPVYKIASFENADLSLLERVAKTKKPVIMSTGMIKLEDLKESVRVLRENGAAEITLLKCTSTYPATPENTNLLTIPDLQKHFPNCVIGLSDHTMGTAVSVAAVALGAKVIEKHFTLSRADGGVDSAFSMEPAELAALVKDTASALSALGQIFYGPTEAEKPSLKFRRSLYTLAPIKKGEAFTPQNIRSIRPASGLPPKRYHDVLNKKAARDIETGQPLTEDMLAD